MKKFLLLATIFAAALAVRAADLPAVLVYTRNGPTTDGKKGYVHDNITNGVRAIEKLGRENGFSVVHSEDASVMTQASLARFRAVIFANSNNGAFDTEEQKQSFQNYIRGGGGFVAIHSGCGSARDWPWFTKLTGGCFNWHPTLQKFTCTIEDPKHPSVAHLSGGIWEREDEFYILRDRPDGLHTILSGDLRKLKLNDKQKEQSKDFPEKIPLAWCQEYEGARAFTTTLGHKKSDYEDPSFLQHILGGIRWAMGTK